MMSAFFLSECFPQHLPPDDEWYYSDTYKGYDAWYRRWVILEWHIHEWYYTHIHEWYHWWVILEWHIQRVWCVIQTYPPGWWSKYPLTAMSDIRVAQTKDKCVTQTYPPVIHPRAWASLMTLQPPRHRGSHTNVTQPPRECDTQPRQRVAYYFFFHAMTHLSRMLLMSQMVLNPSRWILTVSWYNVFSPHNHTAYLIPINNVYSHRVMVQCILTVSRSTSHETIRYILTRPDYIYSHRVEMHISLKNKI